MAERVEGHLSPTSRSTFVDRSGGRAVPLQPASMARASSCAQVASRNREHGQDVSGQRDIPFHVLAAMGEHRAQHSAPGLQSKGSEMRQGKWLVLPRRRIWP